MSASGGNGLVRYFFDGAIATITLDDGKVNVLSPRMLADEVAIGLTLPRAAVEICRQRLSPAHFHRAAVIAEVFAPVDAMAAGFLDRVVGAETLSQTAQEVAVELAKLDLAAHAATKLRARARALEALHEAIELDSAGYAGVGSTAAVAR